jgi:hypothetical protein
VSIITGPVFAIFQATIEPAMQGRMITLVGSLGGMMEPVGCSSPGRLRETPYGSKMVKMGIAALVTAAEGNKVFH